MSLTTDCEMLTPQALFGYVKYNEEAKRVVNTAHQLVCNQNFESFVPSDDPDAENRLCVGCLVGVSNTRNFCGSECPGLGITERVRTLSIKMGLCYLLPMSNLMRQAQSRMSLVGFETIVKYLYDDHFGTDLSTAWTKISKVLVFRNNQLVVKIV